MKLKRTPELHSFLSSYFADTDLEGDAQAVQSFIQTSTPGRQQQVIEQIKILLSDPEMPVEEFGSEANRWFGDTEEATAWLRGILKLLEGAQRGEGSADVVVKDSNGTPLVEGDAVQVIKDLKVKG